MKFLDRKSRIRNGFIGVVVASLAVGLAQSFTSVPMLFATPVYYAEFADAGGLKAGDKVQIAGVDIGLVRSLRLDGAEVLVGFTMGDKRIGIQSHAAIRTDTILGRRNMAIDNHGAHLLQPNGVIPIGQTTSPYQLPEALTDSTRAISGWDIDTVRQSLKVLSDTMDQTSPNLSAALDGVKRFSDTIGNRDAEIDRLLSSANKIAGILGERGGQFNRLLVDARSLLAAVNARGEAISYLLERLDAVSIQVEGLIKDNPGINAVLQQLRVVTGILRKRKIDLHDTVVELGRLLIQENEVYASGPFLKGLMVNLVPGQILQPFIDAAFKNRGIDPEEFWRNAGLPAFRFPDPNGTRLPNGAPPPAPPVLEGTPDHPGPAVPPGSPCSYSPAADGIPTPESPLPCAALTQGPFGPTTGQFGAPDVAASVPNPNGPPPSAGVPAAAAPGEPAPNVVGTPVPLPPAPPGGRMQGDAASQTITPPEDPTALPDDGGR
ncbi:MCE family protein [Mycolicibacterium sp. CBM1]